MGCQNSHPPFAEFRRYWKRAHCNRGVDRRSYVVKPHHFFEMDDTRLETIVQLERHRIRQRLFPLISRLELSYLTREEILTIAMDMYKVLS